MTMTHASDQQTAQTGDEKVSIIAETLRLKYGNGAITVADDQIEAAEADSLAMWIAVRRRLGE